jgi:hypothetical protein
MGMTMVFCRQKAGDCDAGAAQGALPICLQLLKYCWLEDASDSGVYVVQSSDI